jgi:hypothetical protein
VSGARVAGRTRALAVALLLALVAAGPARAQGASGAPAQLTHRTAGLPAGSLAGGRSYRSSASVSPGLVRLGEPVRYRGRVIVPRSATVRWVPPGSGGAYDWSDSVARRRHSFTGNMGRHDAALPDTAEVELTLQAFRTGMLSVPGLAFRIEDPPGSWREGRLPVVRLAVQPVVSPSDTSASLRPLRGPFGAPWWERVPWRIVAPIAGAVLVAALALSRLRRRPPRTAPAVPAPVRDPVAEALAALEALRARQLPEQGRFDEHALRLTRILRRFLEAIGVSPRPGDTTPELVGELGRATLERPEVERLAALLGAWDRVKFARAASTTDEARRAEDAVADLVRRRPARRPPPAPQAPPAAPAPLRPREPGRGKEA